MEGLAKVSPCAVYVERRDPIGRPENKVGRKTATYAIGIRRKVCQGIFFLIANTPRKGVKKIPWAFMAIEIAKAMIASAGWSLNRNNNVRSRKQV